MKKVLAGAPCAEWETADIARKCLRRRLAAAGVQPGDMPRKLEHLNNIITTFEVVQQ